MSTRDRIVQACIELIAAQGLPMLSLRKVADRVGISAPSIYVHFENKEALVAAACQFSMAVLHGTLEAETTGRTARERLLNASMAYLRFAAEHPHLFTLLFQSVGSSRRSLDEPPSPPSPTSPYAYLLRLVQEAVGGGRSRVEPLAYGIWSLVHGSALLRQTHLKDFEGPLEDATRASLEAMVRGWK